MNNKYSLPKDGGLIEVSAPRNIIHRYEKIHTTVYENEYLGVQYVADTIVKAIRTYNEIHCSNEVYEESQPFVLGLTTGRTPLGLYRELVKRHEEGIVSFRNVAVFSLDEFYPIRSTEQQSRNFRIHEDFLNHIDILPENIHIPDGTVPEARISEYCASYDHSVRKIDLMIIGVGEDGQIGFNEPGSYTNTRTRLVALGNESRKSAASIFYGIDYVPHKAITMGLGTILGAKRIILIAWGEEKAQVIKDTVEGEKQLIVPATCLQDHPNVEVVVDEGASSQLTRVKTPWLVGRCLWPSRFIRTAVLWLCEQVRKPILKLTYQDYVDNRLGQLLEISGMAYDEINIQVFNDLQHTITGWPGGKPNADDSTRPERAYPYPKRILIFSPHPDDDVISMGGTFARLVEQGHEVHVAYQTSGSIAVFDDYIYQQMDIATSFTKLVDGDLPAMENAFLQIKQAIANRKPGDEEARYLLQFKAALRRAEARGACRFIGVPEERVHFLTLPFYETGKVKKNPLSQADVDIIVDLLRKVQPHQIYAAGDLADPHGTHGVCLDAILRAYNIIDRDEWFKDCNTWWYRGAWMEWEVEKVDMAVPISPAELSIKRKAIYKHGSQNNGPAFPGDDPREFWQRAEDRNRNTADLYNRLGMAEYEAMEVFTRYKHDHGDSLK